MSRKVFDFDELSELDRIAVATERIADALESLTILLNTAVQMQNISPKDEQQQNEQPIKEPLLTDEEIRNLFK